MTYRTLAGQQYAVPSPSTYRLLSAPVVIECNGRAWEIWCNGKFREYPTLLAAALAVSEAVHNIAARG